MYEVIAAKVLTKKDHPIKGWVMQIIQNNMNGWANNSMKAI